MSIASEINRINTNIASAYQGLYNKGAVMPDKRNSQNLRSAVDSIALSGKDVLRFYDYDGTVLYRMSPSDVSNMTELPPLPSHEGLTTIGWNWSLTEIKESVENNETVDVGCEYTTSDGKTHVYIELDSSMESKIETESGSVTGVRISLGFYYDSRGATVDWGDGETDFCDTSAQKVYDDHEYIYVISHIYSDYPAKYLIKIHTDGTMRLGTHNSRSFFRDDVTKEAVYKLELADNTETRNFAFSGGISLETIASESINVSNGTIEKCTNLKCITCTLNSGSQYDGWAAPAVDCTSLKAICSKKRTSQSDMCGSFLSGDYNMSRLNNLNRYTYISYRAFEETMISGIVDLSSCRGIGYSAFKSCGITRIIGLSMCESIDSYAFDGCASLEGIEPLYACAGIGDRAFNNCKSLRHIEFPVIERIGAYTFNSCRLLDSVVIPSTATSVGAYAFSQCSCIKYIVLKMSYSTNGGIDQGAFLTKSNTSSRSDSMLEWVDLTHYTTADSIPKLNSEFDRVFLTTNSKRKRIPYYVASEEMKAAFSNAANWSGGANNYIVGSPQIS